MTDNTLASTSQSESAESTTSTLSLVPSPHVTPTKSQPPQPAPTDYITMTTESSSTMTTGAPPTKGLRLSTTEIVLGLISIVSLLVNLLLSACLCKKKYGKGQRPDQAAGIRQLPNQIPWDEQVVYQQKVMPRQRVSYMVGRPWQSGV